MVKNYSMAEESVQSYELSNVFNSQMLLVLDINLQGWIT